MAIYRYQHGDRPLEGFTIQHGLGRGGFGEVYFAVSDAGRKVALKAVQNYEKIELRGIEACMNLKNAHLVSIFDIKHNDEGLPFVIMEFVDGPSLRQILDTHPEGLGAAKAAYFLREMAKGVSYLHGEGVVHRDLKPHNVFWDREQNVVKIGDYSLSKAISTSHHSGHTVTVGTVHYMAPEISVGRYDHTVDIYALGVLLYEMLTGNPPFLGDSMGEVLMKHMAGEVDLSSMEEPFARVIKKALSKEPEQRYQTAQDMIDDLFDHAHVQDSVAVLGPESLTMIAEKALNSPAATIPPTVPHVARARRQDPPQLAEVVPPTAQEQPRRHGPRRHGHGKQKSHDFWKPFLGDAWPKLSGTAQDSLNRASRFWLMIFAFASLAVALLVLAQMPLPWAMRNGVAGIPVGMLAAGTIASLVAQFLVLKRIDAESSNGLFRLMHGLIVSLVVMPMGLGEDRVMPVALGVSACMFVLSWRVMGSALRPNRICTELFVRPLMVAGIVAFFAHPGHFGNSFSAMSIVAGMALLVQLASPFDPEASRRFWGQGLHQGAQGSKDLYRQEKPKPAQPAPVVEIHRAPPKQDAVTSPQFVKAAVNTPDLPAGVESASPYGRLFALVLSLLFFAFPIAGLQRFYVGRIGSGFLWLITGGLLGIGQLVDTVMIAVGQFRDADGKRVLTFTKDTPSQILKPVNEYSAVLRDSWTESGIGFKLGNLFLNLVGAILLVACLVIGVIVAVGLPQAFADGVFGQEVAKEIAEETVRDWDIIVNNVLAFVLVIVGTVAAGCLLFARRLTTITHMARVPLAVVGLVAAVTSLGAATQFGRKWVMIGDDVANEMIGSAFSRLFANEFWPALVIACIAFVVSIFILAWPARRVETYVQTSPAVNSQETQSKQTQEKQTV